MTLWEVSRDDVVVGYTTDRDLAKRIENDEYSVKPTDNIDGIPPEVRNVE